MKKIILLPIVILIMSFGMINKVKAETIDYDYYNSYSTNTRGTTFNNVSPGTQQRFDFLLNSNNLDLRNYDKIKGMVYINNITQSKFYSNSLDISLDCTDTRTISNGGTLYTITYPDRTQSTVSGTEYDYYCEHYDQDTSLNINSYQYNFDNKPNILMSLIDTNDQWHTCEVDNMGNYTCPGKSIIKQVVIIIYTNGVASNYNLYLLNSISKIKSDTQEIINNQNQNTTTISNNITNLNDNILNSNLDTNTSSNASNIGSNDIDSGSKNVILDFMLMPITFIQNLLNSFDSTCATLCIGDCSSGHDNDWRFVFPCIDLQSILGSTVYNLIDLLMTFGMVFAFVRSVVGFLKKALLLESDVSSEVRIF